ncbi:helix-turn-helix domain-containing protein [Lysinibacillus sp. 54212]|uniref:helix-turn-helix domain-containing protein n=1 Tax=Lysinibacillus sp. 54212 TaxID=3119829 RepID=UPI002FCA453A
MEVGEVIRKIRKNKNIPSNKVYKNVLSRPAVAKFEKGLSDTSVKKFLDILDALNISLEEFGVIYKETENQDLKYTRSYINAYYSKDLDTLNAIVNSASKDYLETKNEKYRHYQALVRLLMDDINETDVHKSEIDILKQYLVQCDVWGYYEIILFTNSLSFYSCEFIDIVYSRAKSTLLKLKNMLRYRNEVALMLLNILEKNILSKNIGQASFYLTELKGLKNNVIDNMYIQTMILYFTLICKIIDGKYKGDFEEYNSKIKEIINIFNVLGLSQKAIQCESFYKKVKEIYNI